MSWGSSQPVNYQEHLCFEGLDLRGHSAEAIRMPKPGVGKATTLKPVLGS